MLSYQFSLLRISLNKEISRQLDIKTKNVNFNKNKSNTKDIKCKQDFFKEELKKQKQLNTFMRKLGTANVHTALHYYNTILEFALCRNVNEWCRKNCYL